MLRPQTRIVVRGEYEDIDFSNEEDVDGFLAAEAATTSRRRQAVGAFGDPDAAHHYAYRDERLWPSSAHEFGRLFARCKRG